MMSPKNTKRNQIDNQEDEDASGQGGKSGQVEFRDFLSIGPSRDDQLSPAEKKQLLAMHKEVHESRVKKQKTLREERASLREGKKSYGEKQGLAGGRNTQYKAGHPILGDKAQFNGSIDENPLPSENNAETNDDKRDELEYQYRLRYMPDQVQAPRFRLDLKRYR